MSEPLYYRQCLLEKKAANEKLIMVSWIPEPFCTVGNALRLRDEHGIWTNNWIVKEASDRVESKHIEAHARDHFKQRSASDI